MNRKGGFSAGGWVVGLLVFSAVIALFVLMVADVTTQYDKPELVDEGFSEEFDKFQEQRNSIDTMLAETSTSGGLSFLGAFDVLFSATFTIISLVFTGILGVQSQFVAFGTQFNIPSAVSNVFFGLGISFIIATLVFTVINSISRRKI